jgi:hypothetical protein
MSSQQLLLFCEQYSFPVSIYPGWFDNAVSWTPYLYEWVNARTLSDAMIWKWQQHYLKLYHNIHAVVCRNNRHEFQWTLCHKELRNGVVTYITLFLAAFTNTNFIAPVYLLLLTQLWHDKFDQIFYKRFAEQSGSSAVSTVKLLSECDEI